MKVVGLFVIVLGWLIAVYSTQLSSTGAQLIAVLLGLATSVTGVVGVLNKAHLRQAIWKGDSARR